jgi:hypothetical protein
MIKIKRDCGRDIDSRDALAHIDVSCKGRASRVNGQIGLHSTVTHETTQDEPAPS